MCEKHNPLMGLWGRDDLSLGRESMSDLLGQISGLPELLDILLGFSHYDLVVDQLL